MKEYNINKLTSYLHRVNDRLEKYVTAIRADIEQNVVSWPECERLAEAANLAEWVGHQVHQLEGIAKLRANPLCEECMKQGIVTSARCVHHIIPIETARTKDEMKRLAFDINNLRALCFACHARIHKELGSNTAKIVRQRAEARQDRWADNLMSRFVIPKGDDDPTT